MKYKLRSLAIACVLAIAASAQVPVAPPLSRPVLARQGGDVPATASALIVRDASFHSAALGREMPYRILLPARYDASSRRYPVLYLLHGLGGNYRDWHMKTHLAEYAAPLQLIIVMPDAGDSWYTNSAGTPQDKFEDYIVKDLIPQIDKTYRTTATRHARAVGGLSMGGYGALKFALKYPNLFVFAASFSGAMEVPHNPDFKIPFGRGKYDREALEIYGAAGSPTRLANDVFELAAKADPAVLPFLWLVCGTEDGLLGSHHEFIHLLGQQKIAHAFGESPGGHTAEFWDQQLPAMLRLLQKHMDIRAWPTSPKRVDGREIRPHTAAPAPPQH
jgi:putative tributyrin esterase